MLYFGWFEDTWLLWICESMANLSDLWNENNPPKNANWIKYSHIEYDITWCVACKIFIELESNCTSPFLVNLGSS